MRSLFKRALVTLAVATAVVAVSASAASAHVTVNPSQAVQGGYAKLTFRVPNEKDSATTTKLEVVLPVEQPIGHISVKPVPGWTVATEKSKLPAPVKTGESEITEAVTKITWTATGDAAIKPGQFQEFDVSAGPLPQADQIVFKALQTYSDGDVVRWIEVPQDGRPEPDRPAPVLKLTGKTAASPSTAAVTATADDSSDASTGLAVAALAVAALAAVFAGLAWRRRPSGN
ncbi:MAG: YcnI family protein [Hamadaea sp.]|uniref:YcnI family copper-binding membrane protein n=1 Tax=Hamadaea sp. TaxID=2024425 RepID=UPI00180E4A18|nr:YcnI family protein [Hamadaea sp.]NUR70723.1 YcnI family protein [Hamadaea sp.]NUT21411.1 YcnI family protein [Hamadaea sp.]